MLEQKVVSIIEIATAIYIRKAGDSSYSLKDSDISRAINDATKFVEAIHEFKKTVK